MNILPKKRWHVRTRENIARVRRDEAEAAKEEQKRQERILLAEKEARTELLREKARKEHGYIPPPKKEEPEDPEFTSKGHINFFYELERNEIVSQKTNADHEREAKEEREKEEMKIGYLTYLGQDTNELTGNVSWYNKLPQSKLEKEEIGMKEKLREDPLKVIRKYVNTEGVSKISPKVASSSTESVKKRKSGKNKKSKKHKKKKRKRRSRSSSSDSSSSSSTSSGEEKRKRPKVNLEKLREERLKRERIERQRADALLAKLRGDPEPTKKPPSPQPEYSQKYNSQFNPHLAKQNF